MIGWKRRAKEMMNCQQVVDLLSDYLAGELSEQDVAGIRSHLKGCENCENFFDSLKTTVQWTGKLAAEDIPTEVVERLLAFLKSKTRHEEK